MPEPTRVIAGAALPGEEATRVMSDQTQAMARPTVQPATGARQGVNRPGQGMPSYEEQDGGLSKGKIAGIVIGVIAVIAIAIFAVTSLMGNADGVEVPNVIGMTQDAAAKELDSAGFSVKVQPSYTDSDDDKDKVMEQNPKAGEKKSKGSTITIVVSQGKKPEETVKVPDLVGKTSTEAEALLANAGLTGKATEENSDSVEAGSVIWQGTDPDTEVTKGSVVEYKVSKGSEKVNVPGVLGMSYSEASNELTNAGFTVVDGGKDYSDSYPAGQVMSQSVTGSAAKGSKVTIVVSKGPETKTVNVDSLGLTGMSANQAAQALANAGLKASTTEQSSSSVTAGNVISYSPGGTVEEGTTIKLVVSSGSSSNSGGNSNGGTESE